MSPQRPDHCPYCGGSDFIVGKQQGYGSVSAIRRSPSSNSRCIISSAANAALWFVPSSTTPNY